MKTFKFAETSVFLHNQDLPNLLDHNGEIGVDTETTGLNLSRDRLCLIQIGVSKNECHLVQFEKSELEKESRYKNLISILKDKKIKKIFHYARFDLAVIRKFLKVNCENIFCTKIASKLVRTYTDRHGLKDLCKEMLEIDLNKSQQSSDWSASQLSKNQIKYASHDVIFLFELKKKLHEMLGRENRLELSEKLFSFLQTRVDLDLSGWMDSDIFSH
ncbi:MAG: ribonuclease D [Alphaproteobacteria bacterium]|nr:ribonuclease D [Alphaproteobacteria bacterium]